MVQKIPRRSVPFENYGRPLEEAFFPHTELNVGISFHLLISLAVFQFPVFDAALYACIREKQ